MLCGMGKTSVWLPDDLAVRVRESGVPLAVLVRRGLDAGAPDPLEVMLRQVVRGEFSAWFADTSAWERMARVIRDEVTAACGVHGGRDDTPARSGHAPAGSGDAPDGPAVAGEGGKMPGDPSADGAASLRGTQRPGRRDGGAAPVLSPASAVPSPPRCGHKGVRVNGGWCAQCQAQVKPGGRLPDDWVMPQGWKAS